MVKLSKSLETLLAKKKTKPFDTKVGGSLEFCTSPCFALITVVSFNTVKKMFNCLGVKFNFKELKLKFPC